MKWQMTKQSLVRVNLEITIKRQMATEQTTEMQHMLETSIKHLCLCEPLASGKIG